MAVYDPQQFEAKWQATWEKAKLFQGVADARQGEVGRGNLDEEVTTPVDARATTKSHDARNARDVLYLLFAFAYPSGSGLHVGHVESKTALDILARYHRMNGKDVFFPVGWDAFGLPAENYAIKTGVHPAETTRAAIETFRQQIKRIGISYDWQTEIATSHPEYYRWTQWLFLELYKKGLAYQGQAMVNWCPSCQTVLANEQVVNGACERCGSEVIQKQMKQWFFKITEYRDELIAGLDQVDWPRAAKEQQLNWIGKSEGAMVDFTLRSEQADNNLKIKIKCFTTRIDTIFGVTFLAVSPEKFAELGLHNLLQKNKQAAVDAYIEKAYSKTEEERKIGEKDKTGIDTGLVVINPVSGQQVPVYVADYVLAGYGTGAVMGVPAHDARDLQFARKFSLPVVPVIKQSATVSTDEVDRHEDLSHEKQFRDGQPHDSQFHSDYGLLINSGAYDGLTSDEAMQKIPNDFADIEIATTYKLRDWLISRQRYWGAPIPIVYDPTGKAHPIKEEHLPWLLPTDVDFKPTGESPLKSSQEFIERTERLYGKDWRPEFDTMDTFVDSSWYYLRYCDARNQAEFASPESLQRWLPVDFYMIGPEHIVLHLLYSRFFTKFLRDQGHLKFGEPFLKMRHQGMILGPDGKKMSKSKGNVINPDEIISKFGADTLRLYEMFMGPIDADKPWDVRAVVGIYRFLSRVYDLVLTSAELNSKLVAREGQANQGNQPNQENHATQANRESRSSGEVSNQPGSETNGANGDQSAVDNQLEPATQPNQVRQKLHQTIRKVSGDIPELKFNTAIAALMELVNVWESYGKSEGKSEGQSDGKPTRASLDQAEIELFIKILAPFAPFLAEELYQQVVMPAANFNSSPAEGELISVHYQSWPIWDEKLAELEQLIIPVQVNGKLRDHLLVSRDSVNDEASIRGQAESLPKVAKWLAGKQLVKHIYVPGKILNFVVK